MASKLRIITINIGVDDKGDKTDSVALALRDMQDLIDTGWTIVGQSQYQNSVTYTLLSHMQEVSVDPGFGVDLRETTAVPVALPRSTTNSVLH